MIKFKKFVVLTVVVEILIIIIANCLYIYNANNYKPSILREEEDNKVVYKITYDNSLNQEGLIIINVSFAIMLLLSMVMYVYISKKILKPFSNLKDMPYELAKGNLSTPIKEQKNKYFGKFTWGMDMLRETLEDNKKKELEYQKEKKTLILSLSHDIKTPLSAIKLYSKALKDNLYDTEEKKNNVIEGIMKNTVEIEKYVNEIVKNSKEDFMDFSVNNNEIYLEDIVNKIYVYYKNKLEVIHTEFDVKKYNNCLVYGDEDRLVEVIQNIIENAIKYGDGKKISISFSEEEDYKLITIQNSGCDLREEDMPHIFDSFYRGSNSKKQEGSGLGLYISKQLMHRMNGDIYAEIVDDNNFAVTLVVKK